MDSSEVLDVLKQDIELLMSRRTKAIEEGDSRVSLETTRLIKDTLDLINRLPRDTWKDYEFSMNEYLRENFKQHLDSHKFEDYAQRQIYEIGFNNGIGLAEMIIFNKNRKIK